jgi:hypothetical protein
MERTRRWGALAGAVMFVVAVGAAGCDGDLDMGSDAGVATLVVRVLTGPEGTDLETWQPVPGATVALDAPGGARLEEVSGVDGRATFTGLDFSQGTAGVTVHVVGRPLQSVLGIADASQEALVLFPPSPTANYASVSVSGQALNFGKPDGTYLLWVSALAPSGTAYSISSQLGRDYSLVVPANEPFTLVAVAFFDTSLFNQEYTSNPYRATVLPGQLVSGSSIIDLDLANQAETKSASGWIALPPAWCHGLRNTGAAMVLVYSDLDTWGLLGRSHHVEPDAEHAGYNHETRWVEPEGVTPITWFTVFDFNIDYAAQVTVRGGPPEGPVDLQFLDCPDGLTADEAGLASTFSWTPHGEPSAGNLTLSRGDQTTWVLEFPGGVRSVPLPALPSTVDAVEHFGVGQQKVLVQQIDRSSPTTYSRVSNGPSIWIQVP